MYDTAAVENLSHSTRASIEIGQQDVLCTFSPGSCYILAHEQMLRYLLTYFVQVEMSLVKVPNISCTGCIQTIYGWGGDENKSGRIGTKCLGWGGGRDSNCCSMYVCPSVM